MKLIASAEDLLGFADREHQRARVISNRFEAGPVGFEGSKRVLERFSTSSLMDGLLRISEAKMTLLKRASRARYAPASMKLMYCAG
jgi:hypothetical protein